MNCKSVRGVNISRISARVYDIDSFPYSWWYQLPILEHGKHESRSQRSKDYIDAILSLDIETTRLDNIRQSIMYIWQLAINDNIVVVGRTHEELKIFLDKLQLTCDRRTHILIFIFNLSFEFHHLREIFNFEKVFSVARRKPIKANYGNIELRCAQYLTNNNLDNFLKNMRVEHKKLHMDYRHARFPWTNLNASDSEYCVIDVIGLNEGLKKLLDSNGDSLYSIPLTNTGYTRRDVKRAMYKFSRTTLFQSAIPSFELHCELFEAFRGGNTHANRWIAEELLDSSDVGLIHSYDRASSYPDVLLKQKYPYKFVECDSETVDLKIAHGKAILTRAEFKNIRLKNKLDGAPYIPYSKCRGVAKDKVLDNGRILYAGSINITLTDIDINIINESYIYDSVRYYDSYESDYKPLPNQLKRVILEYFKGKTKLKNVEGEEDNYLKFKNRFNAIFGLMVQNPAKLMIEYDEDLPDLFDYEKSEDMSDKEILEKIYYKNSKKIFLLYQWGVWCTSWARKELQDIISNVQKTKGAQFLYTDTDSVKFTGEVDFTEYNERHENLSIKVGAVASDKSGKIHYIGVLEKERDMIKFITHGAKKYAYVTTDRKLHLTCAGVNKKLGAKELKRIENFKDGFVFRAAAGLDSRYNDRPEIRSYVRNGHKIAIYSNIYLSDSTYTVKKSVEYMSVIHNLLQYKNAADHYKRLRYKNH